VKPLLLALLALCSLGRGAEDGGEPFAFAKLPVGARPAAMGQAFSAVGGDAYGLPSNPALLATLQDLRVGSQWASLATRSQQYLAFGRPFGQGGDNAYGLAFHRSALSDPIEKRAANTPDPDSTFTESANVLTAGVAGWLWPQAAWGLSLKVLGENLGDASSGGFSGDVGLLLKTLPWLDLGLAVQDFASHLSWNTGSEEIMPRVMRAGAAAYLLDQRLLLSLDLEKSDLQALRLRLGAEAWLLPRQLALRLGWNQGQWATGAGWRMPLFGSKIDGGLDYAFSPDPLGEGYFQHRISLDVGMRLD
jgi:hypothetical protein